MIVKVLNILPKKGLNLKSTWNFNYVLNYDYF